MARVTGIGGVFLRATDPKALKRWYEDHLGINLDEQFDGGVFHWKDDDAPSRPGQTIWSLFDQETDYFGLRSQQAMINYRVDDLEALLAKLREGGVKVVDETYADEFGKFGWAVDPEGNRFELWEPPLVK